MSMRPYSGTFGYNAAANGTITVPAGALLLKVIAHSTTGGGTVTLLGGVPIPIPVGPAISFDLTHDLVQSRNNTALAGSQDVVGSAGLDMLYVEWVKSGAT